MITFDPDALRTRATGLEQEMGEPGFWDDQQHAAQVSSEHARLTRRLDRYDRLQRDYDDATELLAMDGDLAGELEASIRPLRAHAPIMLCSIALAPRARSNAPPTVSP